MAYQGNTFFSNYWVKTEKFITSWFNQIVKGIFYFDHALIPCHHNTNITNISTLPSQAPRDPASQYTHPSQAGSSHVTQDHRLTPELGPSPSTPLAERNKPTRSRHPSTPFFYLFSFFSKTALVWPLQILTKFYIYQMKKYLPNIYNYQYLPKEKKIVVRWSLFLKWTKFHDMATSLTFVLNSLFVVLNSTCYCWHCMSS